MTMVPRMCSSLNALRMASTAAWSAPFSSPRPIRRAEAIAAASVSRTASSPMFRSIMTWSPPPMLRPSASARRRRGPLLREPHVERRGPFHRLHQPVRRAGRPAFSTHAGVHGMPEDEHLGRALPVHLVVESYLDPGVAHDHVDLEHVVVAGRFQVADPHLEDGQEDAALLDLRVAHPEPADPLTARSLEEAEVAGVVDDPHLVGIA